MRWVHGSDGRWAANHTRNMPAMLGSYYGGLLGDELAEEMHIGFAPGKAKEVGRVLSALTCCAMVVSRNACVARRGRSWSPMSILFRRDGGFFAMSTLFRRNSGFFEFFVCATVNVYCSDFWTDRFLDVQVR